MSHKKVLSADNQQGRSYNHLTPYYVTGFVDGEGSFHIVLAYQMNGAGRYRHRSKDKII